MCSLCRLPVAKNHNFGQILTFLRLLYRPSFTDEGQIWCTRADQRSTLPGQISSECVRCVELWDTYLRYGGLPGWHSYRNLVSLIIQLLRPLGLSVLHLFFLKGLEKLVDRFLHDGPLASLPVHPRQHAYQPGRSTISALLGIIINNK